MTDADVTLISRATRGAAWSGVSTIVLRMGSVVVGIILARVLAPEQFGVYAVALTVQGILITLSDLGLSADIVRSDHPEKIAPTVATLSLVSGVIVASLTLATSSSLATLLGSPSAGPAIAVLSGTLLLAGVSAVPYGFLQRRFQQRELFFVGVADFVVSTVVTLVLIALGFGVLGLAIGRVSAQLVSSTMQFVVARVKPRFGIDREVLKPVLAFGLPIAAANMLSWGLVNVDNIILARVAGATALGFYVLAFNISSWPMSALSQVVRSISMPYFSRAKSGSSGLATLTAIAWAGALPAGAVLAALSAPVIDVVYGEKWLPAAPVLAALGLYGSLRVAFEIFSGYLYTQGRSRLVLWIQIIWLVALVGAMIAATRAYGIVGAGWVHVVVATLVILPAYLIALKLSGVRIREFARQAWWPTVATVPALVVAIGAHLLIGNAPVAVYVALAWPWLRRHLRDLRSRTSGEGVREQTMGNTTVTAARFSPVRDRPGATVSVVIPCFNYARYLPEAVNSVLSQDGVEVDVIIVDDASTDESAAVAQALAQADPRVRVLVNATNSGAVTTFNRGLAEVTGEYIVRLDADDLLTPGSLRRSVAVLQQLPDVGLVYGYPIHFEGDTLRAARQTARSWTVWPGREWLATRCLDGTNTITAPEAVMRASVVDLVGGQRQLTHAHDMEMWLRMAAVSDVAYITGVDQAWHREHEGSLSTAEDSPIRELRTLRGVFEELFSGRAITIEGGAALHEDARRALASEALDQVRRLLDRGADPAAVLAYLEFAASCSPEVVATEGWKRVARRIDRASGRPAVIARLRGVLPRLGRWLRGRARYRRWERSGEYVRMTLTDGVVPPSTGLGGTP
jgi:lipopolysaccharide exporter